MNYHEQQHAEATVREETLDCAIKRIEAVNRKIATLLVEKEELTASIISALGHNHEGEDI